MQDIRECPICHTKLRSLSRKTNLYWINKVAFYIERTCVQKYNHSLQLFTDKITNKVDLIKISLELDYSKFIEIDFINQKSRIKCLKAGKFYYIDIPTIIEPDFPDLEKLKEKVNFFILMS